MKVLSSDKVVRQEQENTTVDVRSARNSTWKVPTNVKYVECEGNQGRGYLVTFWSHGHQRSHYLSALISRK